MSTAEKRFFEDIHEGETLECGSVTVTKDEMLSFAERYDPQPIHLDEDAATDTMFGDVIASGWLTCVLSAKHVVTEFINHTAILVGTGLDEIRYHHPVYAGDTLSISMEVAEKDADDDSNAGGIRVKLTTTNQHDDIVLTLFILMRIKKRER